MIYLLFIIIVYWLLIIIIVIIIVFFFEWSAKVKAVIKSLFYNNLLL